MKLELNALGTKSNFAVSEDAAFETLNCLFDVAEERLTALNHAMSSIHNLLAIYEHVKTYGVTEENRRLFAESFESIGVAYSAENILKTGWEAVKNLIGKIITYIRETCGRLFAAIRKWFNNIFKRDLETMKDKTIPKDKENEFNIRVHNAAKGTSASNEAIDTPIDLDNLKDHPTWKDDGTLASVDSYIKVMERINDMYMKFVTTLERTVKDRGSVAQSDIMNALKGNIPNYVYKLPIAGGWGDSRKLSTLCTTCMALEDTLERQIVPRLEKIQAAASLHADIHEVEITTTALSEAMSIVQWLCVNVRTTMRIAKAAHENKKTFCSSK